MSCVAVVNSVALPDGRHGVPTKAVATDRAPHAVLEARSIRQQQQLAHGSGVNESFWDHVLRRGPERGAFGCVCGGGLGGAKPQQCKMTWGHAGIGHSPYMLRGAARFPW